MGQTEELVTPAEHDQGFKEIEVQFRSGKPAEKIKLSAPTRRQSRELSLKLAVAQDFWPIVEACLNAECGAWSAEKVPGSDIPVPRSEKFVDSLTPQSADLLEMVCLALAYGNDFQKKLQAKAVSEAMALMKPVA